MLTDNSTTLSQNIEDTLLNNAGLLSTVRENNSPEETLHQVIKHLDRKAGADVIDTKDNTPSCLVTAVKEDVESVTKFILDSEARPTISDDDNQSQHNVLINNELCTVLKTCHINSGSDESGQDLVSPSVDLNSQAHKPQVSKEAKLRLENIIDITHKFKKRSGTSGISGQLYETKLLSLILFRALYDDNIKEFVLGSNIDGLGEFDDIVVRYETNYPQETNVIFIQAKHREEPTKNKLTVGDLMKENSDFSLLKYFESYLKIKQKFVTDKQNSMFASSENGLESKFIIYTSLNEDIVKKKGSKYSTDENLIKSCQNGKIFQCMFENKDMDILVSIITNFRVKVIAKTLAEFVLNDNFVNFMTNDVMKTYHVYLAQNVINIEFVNTGTKEYHGKDSYGIGKFRQSFWTTDDSKLILIRNAMCEKVAVMQGMTSLQQRNDAESLLKSHSFKLPVEFGNHSFHITGNEKKRQKRLDYLCCVLYKILQNAYNKDSEYIYLKLNDDSVGSDKIVQYKDFESYRIAGLVGNLFINDQDTEMLKFNLDDQSLSKDCIYILQYLQAHFVLTRFRLDINITNFPKLSLNCKENDRKLVSDFLNKLKFYTNQAKEDEVENVIKKLIFESSCVQQKQYDPLFRIKCDTVFLNYHDKIQKWWKQPNSSLYLTKTCKLYQRAQQEILNSPLLLNIIHFTFNTKIKNNLIQFNQEVINSLGLDQFLSSDKRKLIILSDEVTFTSVKMVQYFENNSNEIRYIFIDLDFVIIENCLENVKIELQYSEISVLIVISRSCTDSSLINERISYMTTLFKGKLIIITRNSIENELKIDSSENSLLMIDKNNFSSLSDKARNLVLKERKIFFQGVEVNVNTVLDHTSLDLLSLNLLREIIDNEKVFIGPTIFNEFYYKTIDHYVKRGLCRYMTMASNNIPSNELHFIGDKFNTFTVPKEAKDVVLITKSKIMFEDIIHRNNDANVHWFIENNEHSLLVWKQSYGSLQNITKFICRRSHEDFIMQLNSLDNIQEKTVIISAEPGMGKSTLLTHLAINTKRLKPYLWILKINLLDHISQFSDWKELKTHINLAEVMSFLYTTIQVKDYSIYKDRMSKLIKINEGNEISLYDYDNEYLCADLSELLLLNYFYNNNNLAILFDGFDEICPDYAGEVIQMLCTLKTTKVAHLWVTTRPYNVLNQLETALGTFSFKLNPLTDLEQKLYLQNVWAHGRNRNQYFFNPLVEQIYSTIGTIIRDIKGFLSIPLHLYMIAEIYGEICDEFYEYYLKTLHYDMQNINRNKDIANLNTLYEKFVNIRFDSIRFGEKKHSISFKDPDLRKMIEKERKEFLNSHKIMAAYFLLDRSVFLSDDDHKQAHNFIAVIESGEEKTGIIERIVGGNPKFVHFAFAEYFAIEFIFDKLFLVECTSSIWDYFTRYLLTLELPLFGVLIFMNSKLERDINFINYFKSKEMYMKIIVDLLFCQINTEHVTTIYVAIQSDFDHLTLFLLQVLKCFLNKENLNDFIKLINNKPYCAFCKSVIKRKQLVVKFILELIVNIDYNKLKYLLACDCDYVTPMIAVITNEQICQYLLNSLQHDSDFIVELLILEQLGVTPTAAHYLSINDNALKFCWDYLINLNKEQLVKIFSVKGRIGELPIHYSARQNNYDFFYAMDRLLGRDELKKMCTTSDRYGFTAICMLPYNENYFDKLKNILEMVYEEPDIDVVDFVTNKIPELYPINNSFLRYNAITNQTWYGVEIVGLAYRQNNGA